MSNAFRQQDIHADLEAEIIISDDGKTIWINIDGRSALRVYTRGSCKIVLEDKRND